jgi:hydrogenase expression/formation protein HypE
MYLANEGKIICVLPEKHAAKALTIMRRDPLGREARVIGRVTAENPGKVVMRTALGGHRLMGMLEGEQLPRIC